MHLLNVLHIHTNIKTQVNFYKLKLSPMSINKDDLAHPNIVCNNILLCL